MAVLKQRAPETPVVLKDKLKQNYTAIQISCHYYRLSEVRDLSILIGNWEL